MSYVHLGSYINTGTQLCRVYIICVHIQKVLLMARQCCKEKCVVDGLQVCDDCVFMFTTTVKVQFSVQTRYCVRDRARVVHSANVNKNVW